MKPGITKSMTPVVKKQQRDQERDRALLVHKYDGIGHLHSRVEKFMSKHHIDHDVSLSKENAVIALLDQALTANNL